MALPRDWNSGGSALIDGHQRPSVRDLLVGSAGSALADAKAIPEASRVDDLPYRVAGNEFIFDADSALTADDVLVVAPDVGAGRFVRRPGPTRLRLPFTSATADAAALLTVPVGYRLWLMELWWRITVSMTGGAASAIGVSSSKTGYSTKGDLLGGAAGDVLATLAASANLIPGTVGTAFDTIGERRAAILNAGETLRFDRITSAFTAGSGSVEVVGWLLDAA